MLDVRTLLELRTWTALDVDDQGRVLAGNDESGSMQLVEIDPDGNRTPLTALPGSCTGRYVPGRRAVVVEHDNAGDERAQLSILPLDELPGQPAGLGGLTPLVHDPRHIHTLCDVHPGVVVYATNRRDGIDFDVVTRGIDSGDEMVIYDLGGYVAEVEVARDRSAAIVTVISLQPNSTQIRRVVDGSASDITDADERAEHLRAGLLAESTDLIVTSSHEREFTAVARVSTDDKPEWTWLLEADDHDITAWLSPDGQRLLVAHQVDGGTTLALHDVDGTHRHDVRLPANGVVTVQWSADSARAVIGLVAPCVPGDVLVVDGGSGEVRTVVSASDGAPPGVIDALVEPTSHLVSARDAELIPCFVYAPASESAGPLNGSVVVNVHGGPEAQAERRFNPVTQALVAAGHTVLVPNVRGSTGYGKRWYSLDDVRLRLDSVTDLADLRSWVPTVGGDPSRVALYGGSYGGYMVLAGLSMQPGLWAAGVDIVGMSSLVTFLENTSDYRRAIREREYGSLAEDRDFLALASPLTYLDDIETPLFVIHGANDPRVPLSESEQIKAALQAKGVPCTMLVYSDEGHGLAKRVNRLDAFPQALSFLATHLAR
ncbi:MAG: prolyl oligopeptidase family serine peptidase [Nocardioidaceae bacterium]